MFNYFSRNGGILQATEAAIPLTDIEYAYGYGVYDSMRVSKGKLLFADEHCQRLLESARIIDLEHPFTVAQIKKAVVELVKKNEAETCNVKVMLVGGKDKASANLYAMCLSPLFPNRKLYKEGVKCITEHYERPFPHAKTLNMLPSYLAFRKAVRAGAYDALLVNRDGNLIEGTRTNFFAIQGKTIISPPEDKILLGVMRDKVLEVALQNGFKVKRQNIKLAEIGHYDGAFITSTSSKIMPIRTIDDFTWAAIDPAILDLLKAFDQYLESLN